MIFFLLFLLFYFFLSGCLIKVTEGLFLERYEGCFYSFLFIGASLAPGIQVQSRFASFACMEGQALASPCHDCPHLQDRSLGVSPANRHCSDGRWAGVGSILPQPAHGDPLLFCSSHAVRACPAEAVQWFTSQYHTCKIDNVLLLQ